MKHLGVLTGGGDCPGLNALIRSVVKTAINDFGSAVTGIEDGYEGLVERRARPLDWEGVSNILAQGGTILGTSNKANPFRYAGKDGDGRLTFKDRSTDVAEYIKELDLDCLVCIGGDGTLSSAARLYESGIPVIGVPKTIDNDLEGTDVTFGFDTAVSIATEAVDRLHSTAMSHHRVMIVEVMGRNAGWIALHAGIAGGADIILIPEIPYCIEAVWTSVLERSRQGKRFSIVVVAEGAKPEGGDVVIKKRVPESTDTIRLGGIGTLLASEIEDRTGLEARAVILGHLLRGGSPSSYDRLLATRLGHGAVYMASRGEFGRMVNIRNDTIGSVPLSDVSDRQRLVPKDHHLLSCAHSMRTSFGVVERDS